MKARRYLSILLAGLLQLMPMLRAVIPMQVQAWAPSAWAVVLRLAGGAVAFMSSYHAASGATSIVTPYTVNGTVGTVYSRQLTTSGQTAHSWSASTAPLGTAVIPLVPGLVLTNSNGKITGIPTQAITTNITISAWENSGNKGASISAVFTFTITNASGPPPPTAPSITTQPQSQTNNLNGSATFTAAASGTAPLSYQWRFNTVPIGNATNTSYTRSNLTTNDAGSYSVVVTNAAGSATSANAILTVVVPSADLTVGCSGPANALPGATVTYSIGVTNLGPTVASNVVVADALPPAAAFSSASGGGTASAGVVTWPTIASLASGAAANFTVSVTAPSGGTLTNSASASSATSDPNAANNNGSAPGSKVTTVVTPQADIAVTTTGPGNVASGASFNYTVVVTNLGPSTASNVVVTDNLPGAAAFVSTTGGGVNNSGVVTWPTIASLASGAGSSFSVTVTAPSGGSLTNRVSGSSATQDPVPANNNGSSAAANAITTVGQQSDLAVGLSGVTIIPAGSNLTYTISVTNLGPSTATNVVVSDNLPGAVAFVNASGGGLRANNVVSWPTIPLMANGATTNYTVTVTSPANGLFTNIALATASTPDPTPANNDGSSAGSQVVTVVATAQGLFGILAGAIAVNPQTGLYEQTVTVTNIGPVTALAVRLFVSGLRAGVQLYNATGTNAGTPYVQYNAPVNPNQAVSLLLQFYVPDRLPISDTLQAQAVQPAAAIPSAGGGIAISRWFSDTSNPASPRFVIEFATIPGRTYTVIYSDNGTQTWQAATPSITAGASLTQWYDDGPPETVSKPLQGGSRIYQVILAPVNP